MDKEQTFTITGNRPVSESIDEIAALLPTLVRRNGFQKMVIAGDAGTFSISCTVIPKTELTDWIALSKITQ